MSNIFFALIYSCLLFGRNGAQEAEGIQMCDMENPCPQGWSCQYSSSITGLQVCRRDFGGNFQMDKGDKSGRCSAAAAAIPNQNRFRRQSTSFGLGWGCNNHQDCPNEFRCCPTSAGYSACTQPQQIDTSPQITIIIEGNFTLRNLSPIDVDLIGTVSLVQSNGFNVLVDTGNVRKKLQLIKSLQEKAGLSPEDIDFVITTHGHPDHYSNGDLFSNVPNNFDMYIANGTKFTGNVLSNGQRYFINGDTNLELVSTPGHTPQCTSLIVRNVTNFGTVAIVGDLFLTKDDYTQTEVLQQLSYDSQVYEKSRKDLACSVNWILPGHGSMFQVDNALRSVLAC